MFKTTTENLFSKERHHVTLQTLQENKIARAFISEAGSVSSGELGVREGVSHQVPDKIISWERKWLPWGPESQHSWESEAVSPRRQLLLGSHCRSGRKPREEKKTRYKRKKCILSLSKALILCDAGPFLGGNLLNYKKAPCTLIPRRTDGYRH